MTSRLHQPPGPCPQVHRRAEGATPVGGLDACPHPASHLVQAPSGCPVHPGGWPFCDIYPLGQRVKQPRNNPASVPRKLIPLGAGRCPQAFPRTLAGVLGLTLQKPPWPSHPHPPRLLPAAPWGRRPWPPPSPACPGFCAGTPGVGWPVAPPGTSPAPPGVLGFKPTCPAKDQVPPSPCLLCPVDGC